MRSEPDETNEEDEKPLYWSILHHKNTNAHTKIHADVGIPHVIYHEKEPLVKECSTKSDLTEVEYGSAKEEKGHRRKWSRVRELVNTNELVCVIRLVNTYF